MSIRSHPRTLRWMAAVAASLSLMMGACAPAIEGTPRRQHTAGPPAPPSPGDLYTPPSPLRPAPPGTLIWAARFTGLPLNPPGTIWRFLYHSRNRVGADIAVSGFAIVPASRMPAGKRRPIYAWAHGTQGLGDQCAPSRQIRNNLPPYGGLLIGKGVALVATDYEGLGTPGEPTYLVGVSEGHAVLDSVRAAAQLPGVGSPGPVVIAGHSQGGGAALWAAQLARSYAPELDVRGVVALAPAAEFQTVVHAMARPPFDHTIANLLEAIAGFHTGYGRAFDPSLILTKKAQAGLLPLEHECINAAFATWKDASIASVLARDPFSIDSTADILETNSPGAVSPGVPVLLLQGQRDEQLPPQVTAELEQSYCRLGSVVERTLYPGVDHDGVIDAAMSEALKWMASRFANRSVANDC